MVSYSRRQVLLAGAGAAVATNVPVGLLSRRALAAPTTLDVTTRVIEVSRRAATVFGILQHDSTPGLVVDAGQRFHVNLRNQLTSPTLVHWHGLTPPPAQDGVPGLSQPELPAGRSYQYDFHLEKAGTNWMHSHVGLQEQQLLAAPLIVRDPRDAARDEQEVTILLHDFTFRDPMDIFAELTAGMGHRMTGSLEDQLGTMAGMDHGALGHGAPAQQPADQTGTMSEGTTSPPASAGSDQMALGDMSGMKEGSQSASDAGAQDLNDVEFDAYLANDRTLADPEVVRVEEGGRVRLRIINGAAATNFLLDLGSLDGELIAVDGNPIIPIWRRRFELAIAQRLDIRLRLSRHSGAYPILAIREGDTAQTGIVLATASARIARVAEHANNPAGALRLHLEHHLQAVVPLPEKSVGRTHTLDLTGNMMDYVWTLNGAKFEERTPLSVRKGERVEVVLRNATDMSHPMHLHGHHFQVVAINGSRFSGAMRDTVLVPARGKVTIAFDADNPGEWALHCHNLYHMMAGMMTSVLYET